MQIFKLFQAFWHTQPILVAEWRTFHKFGLQRGFLVSKKTHCGCKWVWNFFFFFFDKAGWFIDDLDTSVLTLVTDPRCWVILCSPRNGTSSGSGQLKDCFFNPLKEHLQNPEGATSKSEGWICSWPLKLSWNLHLTSPLLLPLSV